MNQHRYDAFRDLHHRPGTPLVLPNAWDHASAAALAAAGFAAIGTTSLGVASAAGKPDATGTAREETLRLGRGLARLPVPVTVDIEGGFGADADSIAALAADLVRAGVAGVNIEDGRPDGTLAPLPLQRELIGAMKEAAPTLFVNARTDTYWLPGHTGETARRLTAYQEAGADGLFVPGLQDEPVIAALTAEYRAPLNILYAPGRLTVARLAELGVARVSTGSLLFRAAVQHAVDLAGAVARGEGDADAGGVVAYAVADGWADAYRM
ncbi:PEP phosphonomutase [Streptomyces agglomeratus]|uniref:PEP phosphonomutase n=1 Tax=Streptomyces agglomeratus TaxID=285458 RepID=A0A1E5PDN2_9ACTN|nr:isocitrate lyase/phosphoenolpyruvate mutase family protein [Streptomyces agglomeratus]OEJ27651.1 PEP phosphonomutase [Streptomyces agglomeratus]OEJ38288.1 PEP phosphonomutase [Streptomyces agglomeratus]OEJ47327.1 PEP phosphonomutase [Streptomyces agglomeratus]OEJ50816.1 PEP phosphonomutase [Streptomyces agglomeratus]OEJ58179.1 PEP phosphonomutase [Streptomyces agglomeratus]